jgi:DNA helicase-2/ATP-dependent DNA helicase PcrA
LILEELLNEQQVEAVKHQDGPLLILAGAGSGKTRVITFRVAYLIGNCGVTPDRILAVTFTNKAAQEMKSRIKKVVGKKADQVTTCTFHSLGVRILRKHANRIGYTNEFSIYDQDDRERLIKECMHDTKVSDKEMKAYDALRFVQDAKNRLVTPEEYMKEHGKEYEKGMVARIYELYEKRLKRNNAMDFDDLISKPLDLFRECPDVLEIYREKFKYVLIDEYQDINNSQYMLITSIADKYRNICVVGDDDQSIYRFRGADITNILGFEEDYPNAKVVKLERNYRSTSLILKAAHAVIKNNEDRKEKQMWTDNDGGEQIVFIYTDDEIQEAEAVLNNVDRLMRGSDIDLKNIAVFYRTNEQSRVIEDHFRRAGIPYKLIGGLQFYGRLEIKDMISYLRLIANPRDVISFKRIINVPPRGIGESTIEKIEQFAFTNDLGFLDALGRAGEVEGVKPAAKATAVKLHGFFMHLIENKATMPLRDIMTYIITETGYIDFWEDEASQKSKDRIENIKELVSAVAEFEENVKKDDGAKATLEDFLSQVALVSDVDKLDETANAVTLMTIHSAKGLEFDNVFLTGMDEGIFPHKNCIEEEGGIEEERRLCYVGITRARKRLYLLSAVSRRQFGTKKMGAISRFINEIPPEFMINKGKIPDRLMSERLSGDAAAIDDPPSYENPADEPAVVAVPAVKTGDRVNHIIMGDGIILNIEPYGDDYKITVAFRKHGKKVLSAKYANLVKAG